MGESLEHCFITKPHVVDDDSQLSQTFKRRVYSSLRFSRSKGSKCARFVQRSGRKLRHGKSIRSVKRIAIGPELIIGLIGARFVEARRKLAHQLTLATSSLALRRSFKMRIDKAIRSVPRFEPGLPIEASSATGFCGMLALKPS